LSLGVIELLDRTDTGRRADMLRHLLNLRIQPDPPRPARDVIIEARRRARRELRRTWE
jgi:hypothetical protein